MSDHRPKRTDAEYLLDWEADVASAKQVVDSYHKGIGVGTWAEIEDFDTPAEISRRESFD